MLRGERLPSSLSPELLARTLQVQGIWFQLLSIAEQNAAMRRRRQTEIERGYDQLRGTFAQVVSSAAASGVKPLEIRELLDVLRIRPVITAHPTEARRVTVLEKHRRIYRRLVDLESPRWTPRERQALIDGLRNEIELLWTTGELRLAKPTVPQEVFWGLHFFNETLFEAVPDLLDKLERALGPCLSGSSSSRFRRSSSSAPGSAATGTGIRSSPTRSPGARFWRTGSPVCAATGDGSRTWSARSASPSAPCRSRTASGRRSRGSWRPREKEKRSPPAIRERSSASISPAWAAASMS